jgi:hypothetical protein
MLLAIGGVEAAEISDYADYGLFTWRTGHLMFWGGYTTAIIGAVIGGVGLTQELSLLEDTGLWISMGGMVGGYGSIPVMNMGNMLVDRELGKRASLLSLMFWGLYGLGMGSLVYLGSFGEPEGEMLNVLEWGAMAMTLSYYQAYFQHCNQLHFLKDLNITPSRYGRGFCLGTRFDTRKQTAMLTVSTSW